jgi:CRISPR-associated endonuclease/helicase Cas3
MRRESTHIEDLILGERSASFAGFVGAASTEKFVPYPFQRAFATGTNLPAMVDVPTGLGKTAMAVLGWLWRRNGGDAELRSATPRRLVYCLPMRTLVEQSKQVAETWIKTLRDAGRLSVDVPIHILMGGEDEDDWVLHPEQDAIIIGTQDMLLSRALNRGYAMSRSRWPIAFGMLNNDCLWIFDEIQLMGPGLATTAQLEAFRHSLGSKDGHGCQSVWMSATLNETWLDTVDFASQRGSLETLSLQTADRSHAGVTRLLGAKKPIARTKSTMDETAAIAKQILERHAPGTRTIVILNTVARATDLFVELEKLTRGGSKPSGKRAQKPADGELQRDTGTVGDGVEAARLVLLHARFRPLDRKRAIDAALAAPVGGGTIVISTQVIEAGVDVSATNLFTELAPWSSLVQRFGRCNRRGDDNAMAAVHWIDLPKETKSHETLSRPYEAAALRASALQLSKLADVGMGALPSVALEYEHTHVLRRKDLVDLFDTTADLAGNDIDIDRFIRDGEETDVRLYWRDWSRPRGDDAPEETESAPQRIELLSAPIAAFRDFVKARKGGVWRFDFAESKWRRVDIGMISPGQMYLVHADAGGYSAEHGWSPKSQSRVDPVAIMKERELDVAESGDSDPLCMSVRWQTIAEHTDDVCREVALICSALKEVDSAQLQQAARWHDRGKAHAVFQGRLPANAPRPAELWAKADGKWSRGGRSHFRHELASALSVLDPTNGAIVNADRDLVAFLVAAHHGKVRLSIRAFPGETKPYADDLSARGQRFARGVWDNDVLPETDLGGGVRAPSSVISLEPMMLGLCESSPYCGEPSWLERAIRLRDTLGPFRLAYLEMILRAADVRASKAADAGVPRG